MATLSNSLSQRRAGRVRRPHANFYAATIILILLLAAAALRTRPDAVPGGAYLRAFVCRSADFAWMGAAVGVLAALALRLRVRRTALLGGIASVALQICLTLWLAWRYDGLLIERERAVVQQLGAITMQGPDGTMTVVPGSGADYTVSEPVNEVTKLESKLLLAAEDERFLDRITNIDPIALVRAACASFDYYVLHRRERQGASGIAEQVSGFFLGIRPGMNAGMWREKVLKMLVAFRVDDRFTREQLERLYLSLCPFGTVSGHEVTGIASAARVFYGAEHTELSTAQTAELIARVNAPGLFWPYRRAGEQDGHFERRMERLRDRVNAILKVAVRRGWMTSPEREEAMAQFGAGLNTAAEASAAVRLEHAGAVFDAVSKAAPDAGMRHIIVQTHQDAAVQMALVKAIREGTAEFAPRLPLRNHAGDRVDVDAILIDSSGAIVAQTGLVNQADDMASQIKPEHYALAVELGVLPSMHGRIPGRRDRADYGLAHSINDDAYAVARAIGLNRVIAHLRSQGYRVLGPYLPVVIGAGVTGSPALVAGNFLKFSYEWPGYRVEVSPAALMTDANTGAVLFQPARTRVFRAEAAAEVRSAMEEVSTQGTAARQLAPLAALHPIAAKTGTAGFFRRGHWDGRGGSWCVAIDSATGHITAIRVRWRSGRPLELEGGSSAAVIMRKVLAASRGVRKGGE